MSAPPCRRRWTPTARRYTLPRVQLRSALPGILAGMRICTAVAWGSIIAVQLIAAISGVGYLIMQASYTSGLDDAIQRDAACRYGKAVRAAAPAP